MNLRRGAGWYLIYASLPTPVPFLAYRRARDTRLWLDERMLTVEGSKELQGGLGCLGGGAGSATGRPKIIWFLWGWGRMDFMTLGCTPQSAWGQPCWPVVPDPSSSLTGAGGAGSPLPPPSRPYRPLPASCPPLSPSPVSPAGRWAAGLSFSRCPLPSLAPRQPHPVVPPSIYGSPAPPAGPAGPFPGRAGPQWKVVEKCGQISDLQHSGKEFIAIV